MDLVPPIHIAREGEMSGSTFVSKAFLQHMGSHWLGMYVYNTCLYHVDAVLHSEIQYAKQERLVF